MKVRDLYLFLLLQFLAIAVAGGSFSLIENRRIAGAIAGSYFVISGLFMFWRTIRWEAKWRSLMIYPLITHVFLISIPMVVSRFTQIGAEFESVKILGLDGPDFHKVSTRVFTVLMCATAIDLVRALRARRKTR